MGTSSSKICQNCNIENQSPFQYCSSCGQKNTDGKITFSELWAEFQDSVLNIDSRTWRTSKNLFIPGKLTLEYFSGKHRRYVHPLRLLLVTSVLFIIAMNFQDFQSTTNHTYNIYERILKNYERKRIYGILENITDSTNTIFSDQHTENITDTILTSFRDSINHLLLEGDNESAIRYGDGYQDSIDLNHYASFGDENVEMVSKRDFLNMEEEELVAVYKKEAGHIERLFFKQKAKLIKDESLLFKTIIGHSTWTTLLMMPCLAFILYLLYIRHPYFYVEHLIFTFHVQSFIFLVVSFIILGWNIFPLWILYLLQGVILIYLFMAMWKVYKQNIFKSFLKLFVLCISYGGLFILFLIGSIFLSLFLL